MPELPEVETTLRGIKPHVLHKTVQKVVLRHHRLRWDIPQELLDILPGHRLERLTRRGKYLLFTFATGTLILHLGMSGRLCVVKLDVRPQKHDHVDIIFENGICLRFTDPRRFGALLWTTEPPAKHQLLKSLGPEPLTTALTGQYLFEKSRNKKIAVKTFIMDGKIVVGVGNIYATEALFQAKIHPEKPAARITLKKYNLLAEAIKAILKQAIQKGGTTLKDFTQSNGKPGYFSLALKIYGRQNKPCPICKTPLKLIRLGQRSTVFCARCQK